MKPRPAVPLRNPMAFACTLSFTIWVSVSPAAVACVPVIVIPLRTDVRTAYIIVDFAKIAQDMSISTNRMERSGRRTIVNSTSSVPRRPFLLEQIWAANGTLLFLVRVSEKWAADLLQEK